QNAVIVGPLGVGKTEIVTAFASKLIDGDSKISNDLKFRQVFILDAGSLIAAAPDRGGLENLVPRILSEAYSAKNIIVCLDNAQLFFEDGIGSVDISNILIPILNAGNLRMILTMDDQQYLKISQRNPEIIKSLNKVVVEAASKDETISVMQDKAIMIEFQNQVTFMYQAIQEAYRLGERYVYDLAMPGRALKILESSAHYSENGLVTAESVRRSLEKTMDIKVSTVRSVDEKEKLLKLEDLIHERMINQSRAVEVVSDAIRRARTGVRNQDKPIGTFLFLGPTGVGKTELAKSLAAVYFNGEDNIIRLDMNEYVQSSDVKRLITDGAKNSNSLTASIMKKPFSVILLDEIEKAHPDVLSTLLQMLDEGVMRDEKNREVSFKDAIIIATSNAGSDRIREYIERGYDISQFEDKFVDELINSNQFKPEFLNRFDEIVVFRPLDKSELMQVVDLILTEVNRTLSLQKISVAVDTEAKKYLVEAGYDPRLGARPMKRVVQRAVESLIAKMMLSGEAESGQVIRLKLEDIKSVIDKKAIVDDATVAN
ncbi:MAG: AAA family ATPase, partial [Candidatus Saccharimonadales bacterium]